MTLNPESRIAAAVSYRKKAAECRNAVRSLIKESVLISASLILIFTFIFGIHIQKGQDMYPAVRDGDTVLYFRTHKVLNTEVAVYSADGETRTGRVAASEGTKISAAGDLQMTFDGRFLPVSPGSGIYSRTYAREGERLPIKLKEGRVFMLGDSRESAIDSRTFGPIARKNIKGRVVAVFRIRQI